MLRRPPTIALQQPAQPFRASHVRKRRSLILYLSSLGRRPAALPRLHNWLIRQRLVRPLLVVVIRSGWADVGISTRLASEEGQLGFLPVSQEPYDLCFARDEAAEPRLNALVQAIRSRQYQRIVTELPGYDPSEKGETSSVFE